MVPEFNQSTMITHTVCHTLCPYYERTVLAGTVILCRLEKSAFQQAKFWVMKAKSFRESIHARGQSGPLFQAMHDYKKSQAINIYVQSY